MKKCIVQNPSAWIVNPSDKGRKKIYPGNKIYFKDGSEFALELFNPLQDSILVELKINGKLASSNGLVLKPGQKTYLDCFLDDKRKFIFNTYEVENSEEAKKAIENNGFIEISFYKEKQVINNNYTSTWINIPYKQTWDITYPFISTFCCSDDLIGYCSTSNPQQFLDIPTKKSEETGRIEKGDKSNQQFTSVDMNFENYTINTVKYQILPDSKKPITVEEIKSTPNFCHNDGYKFKGNEKFCPSCGTRI